MTLAQETIPTGEAQVIQDLVNENLKTVGKSGKRGQHPKHHGLIYGTFLVLDDLPGELAVGVFQPGHAYDCKVRFSNGKEPDDSEEDVRGMAIKLLNVNGPKLLPGRGDATEQDFILVDTPTFFTATMAEYAAFNRYITPYMALKARGFSLFRGVQAVWGGLMLVLFHRKTLRAALTFAGRCAGNPLALTYHSTTPYLLGEGRAVKYKATGQTASARNTEDEDGLAAALWDSLEGGDARFEFGVVIQSDPSKHPVEDATADWENAGAEYVAVAELTLPRQTDSDARRTEAEAIRFSPWMSLAAHRPLGHINRARREVYRALSRLRHRKTR